MRKSALTGFGIAVIAIFLSCSDNPVNNPPSNELTFDRLAILDTTGYFVVRWSGWDRVEPFLTTEKIIGEPFTDVNGNGVYDQGIDGFIISTDPARNQDLNHNGSYDGPNSTWTPGIPFDDIDGNGLPRQEGDGWLPGAPWCDFNHNGKRDGDPFWSQVFRLDRYKSDSTGDFHQFLECESTFAYTSLAGIRYVISTGGLTPNWSPAQSFVRRGDTLKFGSIPVLIKGPVVGDTTQDTVAEQGLHLVFTRSIITGATYDFFGTWDTGLVRVIILVTSATPVNYAGLRLELYLSPGKGPIGYVYRPNDLTQEKWYHFSERVATLPISMTR